MGAACGEPVCLYLPSHLSNIVFIPEVILEGGPDLLQSLLFSFALPDSQCLAQKQLAYCSGKLASLGGLTNLTASVCSAVPIEGLQKDRLSHHDLVQIQSLIKQRVPTGVEAHCAKRSPECATQAGSKFPLVCWQVRQLHAPAHLARAGFNRHRKALRTAGTTLDEISQEIPPTSHLLSLVPATGAAEQLGTLGGGGYFNCAPLHAEMLL